MYVDIYQKCEEPRDVLLDIADRSCRKHEILLRGIASDFIKIAGCGRALSCV